MKQNTTLKQMTGYFYYPITNSTYYLVDGYCKATYRGYYSITVGQWKLYPQVINQCPI